MAESNFSLGKVKIDKSKNKVVKKSQATKPEKKMFPLRLDTRDIKALKVYASNNETNVQAIIQQGLQLAAAELDIDLPSTKG